MRYIFGNAGFWVANPQKVTDSGNTATIQKLVSSVSTRLTTHFLRYFALFQLHLIIFMAMFNEQARNYSPSCASANGGYNYGMLFNFCICFLISI